MIRISGADAGEFVQSQLTVDVADVGDGRLHPAAWCSPDGRARAVLLVGRTDDGMVLVLPAPLAEDTVGKLRMFSIGRDVDLQLEGAARPAGSGADGALTLSYDADRALHTASGEGDCLPGAWLAADIDHGMPWLLPGTTGEFLPQMLGLESLGGLSYGKGCYPGQEVIARVHYRGRVTRRTARFELHDGAAPTPGSTLALEDGEGTVLFAARIESSGPDRTVRGLAVVPAGAASQGSVSVGNTPGALVAD